MNDHSPAALPPHWPHRAHSRTITAAQHRWHVQIMGAGPAILLVHGAGGSLHNFRLLAPLLAARYRVISLDLVGHGFTVAGASARSGLDAMAQDIADLARSQNWDLRAVIGHSAGAAIALRLCQILPLRAAVGLNAALAQFNGVAGWLFPAMAKTLSALPFAAHMASRMFSNPAQIQRVMAQTGSSLDSAGMALYQTLTARKDHVAGTLNMMAAWDLRPLLAQLDKIDTPVLLLTGARDGAVPPATTLRAASRLPRARGEVLQGYGHMLPEEAPAQIAPVILDFLAENEV
jgi:magnesium chelatase accessory protein